MHLTPNTVSHVARATRRRGAARGFTLIELMVVVAIIGVVGALIVGLSSTPYTANPRSIADQINATMSLAKMRAVSSRRWHQVQVTGPGAATPNSVILWQWSQTGMANPATAATGTWQLIEQTTLPSTIVLRDAQTTSYATAGVAAVTEDPNLDFAFFFRPDGSATTTPTGSTGGTLFLDSKSATQPYRIVVYPATGSSYARAQW